MLSVEELSEVGKELSASVSGSWEGPGGLPSQAGAKPWFTGSYSCAPGLHSQLRGAGLCPCKSACVGAVPVPVLPLPGSLYASPSHPHV